MPDDDLPRAVDALHDDGHWYRGWLRHAWRRQDGWHGMVTYTVAPGFTFGRVVRPISWSLPVTPQAQDR